MEQQIQQLINNYEQEITRYNSLKEMTSDVPAKMWYDGMTCGLASVVIQLKIALKS